MRFKPLARTTNSTWLINLDTSTEEAFKAKEVDIKISLKEGNIIKDLIIKHIKTNSITKIRDLLKTIEAVAKITTIIRAASTRTLEVVIEEVEGEETTEK